MTVAFAPVSATARPTVSKIGIASNELPPFPGVTPATICVPYSLHARVWNWPVAPVIPCVKTRVSLLTRTAILHFRFYRSHDFFRRFRHRLRRNDRQTGIRKNLFPDIDVGSLHSDD